MSNRTDIVVETDNAEGQVLLSASRVYDLTEDKTQDTINGEVKNTLNSKADEESLALRRSGATNTGAQIETGTFFYLDGTLKRAIATIAQNASFTAQNCETVTAGGLNSLNNSFVWKYLDKKTGSSAISLSNIVFNELFVVAKVDDSNNPFTTVIPVNILNINISSFIRFGAYVENVSGALTGYVLVEATKLQIKLNLLHWTGTDKTSTSTLTVYYR